MEKLPLDGEPPVLQVAVGPPKGRHLSLPGAAVECERVEGRRLRPRGFRGRQERPSLFSCPDMLQDVRALAFLRLVGHELRDVPRHEVRPDRGIEPSC